MSSSKKHYCYIIIQFSLILQYCSTLCNPMDCSTSGFRVHQHLLELAQTHIHWVGDAIQLSHPLATPSSPAFNLSQHQGLLQGVSSLHYMAKVLKFHLQHQSFEWIFRTDLLYLFFFFFFWSPLEWTGLIFLLPKGLSRIFSNTTVQKHQFFSAQLSL